MLIINVIISFDNTWLVNEPTVVSGLLHIWVSPDFHDHHRRIVSIIVFIVIIPDLRAASSEQCSLLSVDVDVCMWLYTVDFCSRFYAYVG